MEDFARKIGVIAGGGTGMGRELARQLVAEGCNVAMCDVSADAMAETKRLCEVERLPQGLRITTHVADVSIEEQLLRFRDELTDQQATDRIHLLFNNAGIGGGGSLFTSTREQWERTFNICWGGVYLGVRTLLPMLLKADEGHIVNTSSVNGFWASIAPGACPSQVIRYRVEPTASSAMSDMPPKAEVNSEHWRHSDWPLRVDTIDPRPTIWRSSSSHQSAFGYALASSQPSLRCNKPLITGRAAGLILNTSLSPTYPKKLKTEMMHTH